MIWITSDTHFGHKNILRPDYCNRIQTFKDIIHMNEQLIANWNSRVSPEDTVFFLGDFSMNKNFVPRIAPRLNGIKISIQGNHDVSFRGTKNQFYLDAGFSLVYPHDVHPKIVHERNGILYEFLLSHLPYVITDGRYVDLAPKDEGVPQLHGHSHATPDKRVRFTDKGTFMLDCGVDGTAPEYRPISIDEVVDIYLEHTVGSLQ